MTVAATQTSLSCPKRDALLPQSLLYNIITSKLAEAFELTSFHVNISHYSDNLGLVKREDECVDRPSCRFTEFTQSDSPHLDLLLPTMYITPSKKNNDNNNCYSPDTYHAPKRQRLNSLARTPSSPDVRNIIGLTTKKPETNENVLQCPNCKQHCIHKDHFNNHIKNCTIPKQMAVRQELTYDKDNQMFGSDIPISLPSEKPEPAVSDPLCFINKHSHTGYMDIKDLNTSKDVGDKDEYSHIKEHSYATAQIKENAQTDLDNFVNEMMDYFRATTEILRPEDREQQNANSDMLSAVPAHEMQNENNCSKINQPHLSTNFSQLSSEKKQAEHEQCKLKYSIRAKRLVAMKNVKKSKQCNEAVKVTSPCEPNSPIVTPSASKITTDTTCKYEHKVKKIKSEHCYQCGKSLCTKDHSQEQLNSHEDINKETDSTDVGGDTSATTSKILSCSKCRFIATKAHSIELHNVVHTTEKPYLCMDCDYHSSFKSHFNIHIRTHTKDCPFMCPYCNIGFTESQLRYHMRSVHPDAMLQCEQCTFTASLPTRMEKHKRLCHSNEIKNELLQCQQCTFVATKQISLEQHHIVHTAKGPYKCTDCEYETTHKTHFNDHILSHNKDRPIYCPFCNYSVIKPSDRKKHVNLCHADLVME